MSEFEVWMYRLIIAGLALILWWGTQRLIRKFDELIESINELTSESKTQRELLSTQNKRIEDHAARIRSLEIKRAECQHCHITK